MHVNTCWIFCRFLSAFFNSSWTLLFYWKQARNQASAISAFPPPIFFSSLHVQCIQVKGYVSLMNTLDPGTHTLFKGLLLLLPSCRYLLPTKRLRNYFVCLSFIYWIYCLLCLSSVLCLHPIVYPGNCKYIKLKTVLYEKNKKKSPF